ncbi:MAG: hypothetical protein MZU95_09020 [Desulfomicrobium escambiense]|nr:hypothetical protein [Desulfomicrobium escambiense]
MAGRRHRRQAGRRDHPQRHHRRGLPRRPAPDQARAARRVQDPDGLGATRSATIKVRTNADTPYDAANAVELGAEGIGLCRTEHMFFDTEERRLAIQEMIVADTLSRPREGAWTSSCPSRRRTSRASSRPWTASPVTIRLIDPPLHEFVPHDRGRRRSQLATGIGVPYEKIRYRVRAAARGQPHARPPRLPPVPSPTPRSWTCR